MDIATVAVHSDPDHDAPHVHEADESVHLAGSTPRDTYLNIPAIIRAAQITGADAIHPGYGFLSENAEFARACAAAGLVFVGPTPEVIESMGSKLAAKALMERSGVPILPGETIDSIDDVPAAVERLGLPVLVKAAFGGGGRGMRVVRNRDDAIDAVAAAQREASSAFGNGTVFLERYLETPRHIEVQIFGDTHGNVIHLFERECSIQRRYQKIVEEAPSPAVDESLRQQLGDVAVRAAQALGYVGAGTVEFVMDTDRSFYFLEVNTRLQVEHPVTEMITGLDLVELQLRIARGEALPESATNAQIHGHAIEVRLYAEDVPAGYLPVSGDLVRFEIPTSDGVRVDSGYEGGSHVSTFYDAMLAKVISWAPDRKASAEKLARSLAAARLHGPTTNRDLLVRVLRHPEFLAGDTDTAFLTRNDGAELGKPLVADHSIHALAAALAAQASRRLNARVQSSVSSGFRNVPTGFQQATFRVQTLGDESIDVRYRTGAGGLEAQANGVDLGPLTLWSASPRKVDLTYADVRRVIDVDIHGDRHFVDSSDGFSVLHLEERFPLPGNSSAPGSLLAGMPGTVVAVSVAVGDIVEHGHPLIVLEAMKMEHAIRAPHRGVVAELHVGVGDQVASGALLAVVEEVE